MQGRTPSWMRTRPQRPTASTQSGRCRIEPHESLGGFATQRGNNGNFYAQYGIGQPLLAIPFYLLGRALAHDLDYDPLRVMWLKNSDVEELLELFRLDTLASHGDLQAYDWCREVFEEISQEEMKPPPLLTGHDLIDMGFKPGPVFSEILDAVEDGL